MGILQKLAAQRQSYLFAGGLGFRLMDGVL